MLLSANSTTTDGNSSPIRREHLARYQLVYGPTHLLRMSGTLLRSCAVPTRRVVRTHYEMSGTDRAYADSGTWDGNEADDLEEGFGITREVP
eukprot:2358474-Rhodomonas_salina.10